MKKYSFCSHCNCSVSIRRLFHRYTKHTIHHPIDTREITSAASKSFMTAPRNAASPVTASVKLHLRAGDWRIDSEGVTSFIAVGMGVEDAVLPNAGGG